MAGKTFRMPPIAPKIIVKPPVLDWSSAAGVAANGGSEVQYSMSGLKQMLDTIDQIPQVYKDAAGYEVEAFLQEVMEDSKENFCPFLFGNLRASADHDEYEPNKGTVIIEMSVWYAGATTVMAKEAGVVNVQDYALEQHENMSYHHDIGGPKYLERPFLARANTIAGRIASAIERAQGNEPTQQYLGFSII